MPFTSIAQIETLQVQEQRQCPLVFYTHTLTTKLTALAACTKLQTQSFFI